MPASDDPEEQDRSPSPSVAATLATLDSDGIASPIRCTAPADNAGICTAALTYWYLQSLEGEEIGEADLDRAAARIARFVASTRRCAAPPGTGPEVGVAERRGETAVAKTL